MALDDYGGLASSSATLCPADEGGESKRIREYGFRKFQVRGEPGDDLLLQGVAWWPANLYGTLTELNRFVAQVSCTLGFFNPALFKTIGLLRRIPTRCRSWTFARRVPGLRQDE